MFIDFKRAFPSVPHDKLWLRLHELQISTRIINILQQLYANATTRVRIPDGHTQDLPMTIGLLQGDSLSPLLFALYIHDIERKLQESNTLGIPLSHEVSIHTLLFADDTVVIAPNAGQLRKKIQVLEQYFDKWDLIVNMEKTKVVVFRKGGRLEKDLKFHYKDNAIEKVDEYVYLGVLMTSSGLFARQAKRMKDKAKKVSKQLVGLIYRTKMRNFHAHYTLFESVVKPTLLYASAVWGHRYKKQLEPVQNCFYRQTLGLHHQLSACIVRRETASHHIECSIWRQTIKFIGTIKRMDASRYAFIIFHKLIQLDQQDPSWEHNWITQVKQGLVTFGLDGLLTALPEEFPNHAECGVKIINEHFDEHDKYVLERFKHCQYAEMLKIQDIERPQRQQQQQQQQQRNGRREGERSERWDQLPWYLRSNITLQNKKLIAQLRQDRLYMNIQGRKVDIPSPTEEKVCPICNTTTTDSISHVLLSCRITAVKKQALQERGWHEDKYFDFLGHEWDKPNELCNLVLQSLKIRQFTEEEMRAAENI